MTRRRTVHCDVILNLSVTADEEAEVEARAEVSFHPGCDQWWDRAIGAWMPPDPPEAELLSLEIKSGAEWVPCPEPFLAILGDMDWAGILASTDALEPEYAE